MKERKEPVVPSSPELIKPQLSWRGLARVCWWPAFECERCRKKWRRQAAEGPFGAGRIGPHHQPPQCLS
jgi:hypothetical protein